VAMQLAANGLRSVMVEGGARVIQSFLAGSLALKDGSSVPLACNVVVTVGPRFFISGLTVAASISTVSDQGAANDEPSSRASQSTALTAVHPGASASESVSRQGGPSSHPLALADLAVLMLGRDIILQGSPSYEPSYL
jgi:hypothetical protein